MGVKDDQEEWSLFEPGQFMMEDSSSSEEEEESRGRREREERLKFLKVCEEYRPSGELRGWFNDTDPAQVITRLTGSRNGPSEVKHSMEYHYLHKRYHRVCELGQIFLENQTLTKVNNIKETVEIIIRAHLQLNQVEEAYSLLRKWDNTNDPYQIFLKGQLSGLTGHLSEAIKLFQRYLQFRPNDYQAWKEIGLAIERYLRPELRYWSPFPFPLDPPPSPCPPTPSHPATLCYDLSLHLFNLSQWHLTPTYHHHRHLREQTSLTSLLTRSFDLPPFTLDPSLLNWLLTTTTAVRPGPSHPSQRIGEVEDPVTDPSERSVLNL